MTDTPAPKPRGFAALSPERRRELATMGGKAGTGIKGVATLTPEKLAEVQKKALAARRSKKALTAPK